MISITGCEKLENVHVTIHQNGPQIDTPKQRMEERRMGSPRQMIQDGVIQALAFLQKRHRSNSNNQYKKRAQVIGAEPN